jgi:ankyrin repeat protein
MEQVHDSKLNYYCRKIKEIIQDSGGDCFLARNADGEIPLHTACKDIENNDIVIIILGCNAGRDGINYHQSSQLQATNEIFGNTPLHIAACLGNDSIVGTILECGNSTALLKETNKIGDTPVHGAASRGHVWYGI